MVTVRLLLTESAMSVFTTSSNGSAGSTASTLDLSMDTVGTPPAAASCRNLAVETDSTCRSSSKMRFSRIEPCKADSRMKLFSVPDSPLVLTVSIPRSAASMKTPFHSKPWGTSSR